MRLKEQMPPYGSVLGIHKVSGAGYKIGRS
jgi:hypothetical protein